MVQEYYEKQDFQSCIVVALFKGELVFIRTGHHKYVPSICQNAFLPGEFGELKYYNTNVDPRHIVWVCIEQCKNIW